MENSSFVLCKGFYPLKECYIQTPSRGNTENFSNEYFEHTRKDGKELEKNV